jgi:hypothetical protein
MTKSWAYKTAPTAKAFQTSLLLTLLNLILLTIKTLPARIVARKCRCFHAVIYLHLVECQFLSRFNLT